MTWIMVIFFCYHKAKIEIRWATLNHTKCESLKKLKSADSIDLLSIKSRRSTSG